MIDISPAYVSFDLDEIVAHVCIQKSSVENFTHCECLHDVIETRK